MDEKEALRERMRQLGRLNNEVDFSQEDQATCRQVLDSALYRRCSTLFAFFPIAGEVDITPVLNDAILARRLALPRTHRDGSLSFHTVTDLNGLQRGRYQIAEPAEGGVVVPGRGDLMLIPALAYDRGHHRLGRGKGYYDRYLSQHNSVTTVGVCRSYQLVEEIPTETWDRMVDQVISCGILY